VHHLISELVTALLRTGYVPLSEVDDDTDMKAPPLKIDSPLGPAQDNEASEALTGLDELSAANGARFLYSNMSIIASGERW
jgi:hypothetical protein